jgi:hypothetical protein
MAEALQFEGHPRMVRRFETRATTLPTKMLQAAHHAHQIPV